MYNLCFKCIFTASHILTYTYIYLCNIDSGSKCSKLLLTYKHCLYSYEFIDHVVACSVNCFY